MEVLFVHGMGRTPLSGWPMLCRLRRAGFKTHTFGYFVCAEDFRRIRDRLAARIAAIARRGDYVLIGHSLGGVLIRAALDTLPHDAPPPSHTILLGSPVRPSRVAQKLGSNPVFRWLTGDCGQLLGSAERMAAIAPAPPPVLGIAGIRGPSWLRSFFDGEPNDGIVSLSEVSADWLHEQVQLPVLHTWLPSSGRVTRVILDRLPHGGHAKP